jgi:hypothetical protein
MMRLLMFVGVCWIFCVDPADAQDRDKSTPQAEVTWVSCADVPADAPEDAFANCIDAAGPAIGEIDPQWRQRMPAKVRWVVAKDAVETCQAGSVDYGKVVAKVGERGCVWLTDSACTILTTAYLAHAEIGNALRGCASR